jgi:hypothetical protein
VNKVALGVITAIAVGAATAALAPSVAHASTYSFVFSDSTDGVTASGTLDISGGYAIDGTGTITSPITGTESLTLMTLTSPGSAGFVFPDGGGVFSYRWTGGQDLIADDQVPLTSNGLDFGVGSYDLAGASFGNNPGYLIGLNIWSNGGDSYTAYVATNAGTNAEYNGTFSLTATPLPPTWTMLIAGFIGLGFFAYRGSNKNRATFAAV